MPDHVQNKEDTLEIKRNPKGYYTLYVNGVFHGNYDTVHEATMDYEAEKVKETN